MQSNAMMFMSLSKMLKVMDQRCYEVVKEDHLTKNEMIILMFLSNNKNYDTASDIIKVRGLSKAHVAQSIDSLCKKGYLITCVDYKDRRILHLSIDSSADEIVQKINKQRQYCLKMIFEGFSAQQKKDFMQMVKQVVKNTEKLKEEKNGR